MLRAVPSNPDLRIPSNVFEVIVQRHLRAPPTCLAGVTRSRTYGKFVDAYGDVYQNDGVHSSRHALVLSLNSWGVRAATS